MLSYEEALQMISKSSKYHHSILVSKIMKYVAKFFQSNETEWAITGLLHDLDYDLIGDDSNQHGVLAASMLDDKVPETVKHAIKAHHPTTGYKAETLLDKALIFADCTAWLIDDQHLFEKDMDLKTAVLKESAQKPKIVQNIESFATINEVSLEDIIKNLIP
jgi:putative nucleotidyltransferase with HDIG domain